MATPDLLAWRPRRGVAARRRSCGGPVTLPKRTRCRPADLPSWPAVAVPARRIARVARCWRQRYKCRVTRSAPRAKALPGRWSAAQPAAAPPPRVAKIGAAEPHAACVGPSPPAARVACPAPRPAWDRPPPLAASPRGSRAVLPRLPMDRPQQTSRRLGTQHYPARPPLALPCRARRTCASGGVIAARYLAPQLMRQPVGDRRWPPCWRATARQRTA